MGSAALGQDAQPCWVTRVASGPLSLVAPSAWIWWCTAGRAVGIVGWAASLGREQPSAPSAAARSKDSSGPAEPRK